MPLLTGVALPSATPLAVPIAAPVPSTAGSKENRGVLGTIGGWIGAVVEPVVNTGVKALQGAAEFEITEWFAEQTNRKTDAQSTVDRKPGGYDQGQNGGVQAPMSMPVMLGLGAAAIGLAVLVFKR